MSIDDAADDDGLERERCLPSALNVLLRVRV